MRCPACRTESRPAARYSEECGTRLEVACAQCGAAVSASQKFCANCGALAILVPAAPAADPDRFVSPRAYTPAHLAERILKDRSALSGERKQVSVLFADVSGFTGLGREAGSRGRARAQEPRLRTDARRDPPL